MSIADNRARALTTARKLSENGMPLFVCRLRPNGDPAGLQHDWEHTKGNADAVKRWGPGRALCGVTGILFDVIDVDPRNGGKESWDRLVEDLGDEGPEVYWTVFTPSGGTHFYIAPLGIGSRPGFLPGIDLKGGLPDGESRGFVFMPPTERPSQVDGVMRAYIPRGVLGMPNGDDGSQKLRDCIGQYESERRSAAGESESVGGRPKLGALRQACLDAPPGGQRLALLRYTHEMERIGYDAADILALLENIASLMPLYNPRWPWSRKDLKRLLHKAGEVIPDADAGELAGLEKLVPRMSLVESLESIEPELTEWWWHGYGAFGEMTVLDGEKGQGKTLITLDIIARATRGLPMPGQEVGMDPVNCIIFAEESSRRREIVPRLHAANADMSRVFMPRGIKHDKRGKAAGLVLPDSAAIFRKMIQECSAQIAAWDPITDFLAESIQTHNDASVRRALRPLGVALSEIGCSGWMLRHMNKDSGARAKFRGAGTTAFQNRARVHLVTGTLPGSVASDGRFGLAVVDSNLLARADGVLAYSIVDSEMDQDTLGGKVARVEWHNMVSGLNADELTAGAKKRGPRGIEQEAVREVLEELFARGDTWPASVVKDELSAAGVSTHPTTLQKVKDAMGIRSVARRGGKRGVGEWMWTVLPPEKKRAGAGGSGGEM